MKDGVARIVVEMMKREWPQHWPQLLDELSAACLRGPAQTELVLLVLLRVAEDVVAFRWVCRLPGVLSTEPSISPTTVQRVGRFYCCSREGNQEKSPQQFQDFSVKRGICFQIMQVSPCIFVSQTRVCVTHRNVPPQRNKEMQGALTSCMDQIFSFFLEQLCSNTELYKSKVQVPFEIFC